MGSTAESLGDLTSKFQPWILNAKQGGNGHSFKSLSCDPPGDWCHHLPVEGQPLYQWTFGHPTKSNNEKVVRQSFLFTLKRKVINEL